MTLNQHLFHIILYHIIFHDMSLIRSFMHLRRLKQTHKNTHAYTHIHTHRHTHSLRVLLCFPPIRCIYVYITVHCSLNTSIPWFLWHRSHVHLVERLTLCSLWRGHGWRQSIPSKDRSLGGITVGPDCPWLPEGSSCWVLLTSDSVVWK